jgi:thiol:disulfide interchange protein
MSPLGSHEDSYSSPKPPLESWCYWVGFASLVPFLGLPFALVSAVLGFIKMERRGGWALLPLSFLGLCVTLGLTAVYYDQIFPIPVQTASSLAPGAGEITWLQPGEGLKLSLATGKPILYDFTAHWCGWCKRMDAAVFDKSLDASKINSLYVPVVVMDMKQENGKNTDDVAELQSKYQVRGYPTLVVQYPNNGASRVMVGFGGEDKVMAFLAQ